MNPARKTIGIFLNDSGTEGNIFLEELQKGFIDFAEEKDINIIFLIGGRIDSPYTHEKNRNVIYNLTLNNRIDGFIYVSHILSAFIDREKMKEFILGRSGVPALSSGLEIDGIPSMVIDNRAGMTELINHLIKLHHRKRIAMIRGPGSAVDAEERYFAYLHALNVQGIPVDPALIVQSDFSVSGGMQAVRTLLDKREVSFDALVAVDDDTALGAIHELTDRGIDVPGTVAVTGFDDSLNSRQSTPSITTVHQPIYEFSYHAMEIMLRMLTDPAYEISCIHYPVEPKFRESCGCTQDYPNVPDPVTKISGGVRQRKTGNAISGYVSSIGMGETIRTIGDNLQFSKDISSLFRIITQLMPSAGVTSCYVVMYESPDSPFEKGSLEYAFMDGKLTVSPENRIVFNPLHLLPKEIKSLSRNRHTLYLEPLFYGDLRIGYILIGCSTRYFPFYESFRDVLSRSLVVALYKDAVKKIKYNYEVLTKVKIKSLSGTVNDLQKTLKKLQDSIAGEDGPEFSEGMHDIRIQRAIVFIHDHYNDPISLEDVAREAYISPSYLSTVFKQEVGKGFSDYLTSIRIKKSLVLLKNPCLKIKEIAGLIGYPNVQYFIQLFKRETGCTPHKYREKLI